MATDLQGSIKSTFTADGTIDESYTYNSFGNAMTGELGEEQLFGYNGKPLDNDTGLYNYGFRDYQPVSGRFNTVDPIKDGLDWYGYCGFDPINYVDLLGLVNVDLVFLDMHDSRWGSDLIGNSADKVNEFGCYLMGFTSATNALTGNELLPTSINGPNNNFAAASGSMDTIQAAANQGLIKDYWTKGVQGDLSTKIDELNNESINYAVLAQTPYNDDGDLHWVGVNSGTTTLPGHGDTTYVNITGTSKNDSEDSRPDNWEFIESSGQSYIPTSAINQIHTYTKNKENS